MSRPTRTPLEDLAGDIEHFAGRLGELFPEHEPRPEAIERAFEHLDDVEKWLGVEAFAIFTAQTAKASS